jgi:hypothetical protein
MSKYRVHAFECRSLDALKEAIADLISRHFVNTKGMTKAEALEAAREIVSSDVKVSLEQPTCLYGYQGDQRAETAQVRIPRLVVNQYLSGGASNDAGFNFTQTGCEAVISDYDKGSWWNASEDRFWQVAACKEACSLAWLNPDVLGVEVEETEEGNLEIYCTINE